MGESLGVWSWDLGIVLVLTCGNNKRRDIRVDEKNSRTWRKRKACAQCCKTNAYVWCVKVTSV